MVNPQDEVISYFVQRTADLTEALVPFVPVIVSTLGDADPVKAQAACQIIINHSIGNTEVQQAYVDAGAIPAIVTAMATHDACDDVQEHACVALNQLATLAKVRRFVLKILHVDP
jgi:hypothetical protein